MNGGRLTFNFQFPLDILITTEPLRIERCLEAVSDPGCGGIATFIGTVRDSTAGRAVIRLEYECYEKMAVKEIRKICEAAISQFSVRNIAVHHRTGMLFPGDAAVVVAVSDGHRNAVFKACSFIIDTVKERVPIWKKEIFEDGEIWVSAHP